jgi:hypothetical protein
MRICGSRELLFFLSWIFYRIFDPYRAGIGIQLLNQVRLLPGMVLLPIPEGDPEISALPRKIKRTFKIIVTGNLLP